MFAVNKPDYKNKTALLCDNDLGSMAMMHGVLQNLGFNNIEVETQAAAEAVLQQTKPDIAIFGLMLEYMDSGFILGYHVKKMDDSIPVILVTDVAASTGLRFSPDDDISDGWIKADKVIDKGMRRDQFEIVVHQLLQEVSA
jgi:response regulator RpfG family c-di-GMP phosphodiesterase